MRTPRRVRALGRVGLLLGAFVMGGVVSTWWRGGDDTDGAFPVSLFPSVMAQASRELGQGEYRFLPSRRSVWVVNTSTGRMAAYTFQNNEYATVQRSRVAQIDLATFPMAESQIMISDRNLHAILWVGNHRTGDVQMWTLSRDGEVRKAGPVATSADLMVRQ